MPYLTSGEIRGQLPVLLLFHCDAGSRAKLLKIDQFCNAARLQM
jgi:hypothetical protein